MKKFVFQILIMMHVLCLSGSISFASIPFDSKVHQVQERLEELKYNVGPIDGKLGPKTRMAILTTLQPVIFTLQTFIYQDTIPLPYHVLIAEQSTIH